MEPVIALAVVTLPPAATERNVTIAPGTGRLSAAWTSTTNGWASTLPATPVCAPPLTTTRRAGGGTNVMRVEPVMPDGVIALIVVTPRRP